MADVYQIVTDRMIEQMEAGTVPWRRPWFSAGKEAHNRVTGKTYSFLNRMLLSKGGEWATIKQWNKLGGNVRKGEKSEMVVFWKFPEKGETKNDGDIDYAHSDHESAETAETRSTDGPAETRKNNIPVLKWHRVFHVSQVEGVEPLSVEENLQAPDPIPEADKIFRDYIARENILLEEGYDEACYSPTLDMIRIPGLIQFECAEEFYSTAFHECIHSTGKNNRLAREGVRRINFGSGIYSREELVAEIGAASMLNILGIETDTSFRNSTCYVQSWIEVLKNDKRAIVMAAAQAEKAVNYIIGKQSK